MGVPFKKIARKDPRKADAVAKFYPQLVTLGDNATLDEREEFADAGRHPECIDQFCGGHDYDPLQWPVGEYQELWRIQSVGAYGRRTGCKGVHRKEHQGGENQFPAFQHRKTGHRRHACRAED